MEFGVLGPLVVIDGGRLMRVSAAKQRVLLACLLLRAGEVVTSDELAEAIWGDELPANPRGALQTYVTRLRKLLGGNGGLLQGRPEGYLVMVAPQAVDAGQFELLVEQAREAAERGDHQTEAAVLRQALGLWRGEPLADVPSERLRRGAAARLSEQRLEALQQRIEADLALGRHGQLVAELGALTERYPLRERLWGQLLVALYRSGRQADALAAYQRVRRLLVEELGVDPGPELQRLHQAVLTSDPTLEVPREPLHPTPPTPSAPAPVRPRAWDTPSQLPVDVADFVGRAGLVDQVEGLLGDDRLVRIVAVSGPPGVGKTALAVHVAHRLRARFPDGQLYVDLHGATAGLRPLTPLEVLGRFLRALGADPATIPTGLEEASAAWRSRVAGRRLLVLLDNAADTSQVAPLLPGGPGCGVLVTSRRALLSLQGAVQLELEVLAPAEAGELLDRLAGQERVAAEPEAAADLADLCGWLPLALWIAGARLAARPSWPVRALAERLADTQRRLDELALPEVGVRASLAVSYEQLQASDDATDRAAAGAFGLLGLLDGPEVGVPVVARLLDQPESAAEQVLERLVDAHLLETPRPGRYRLHDLLRLYARELADQHHPERVQAAALTRALGFYVATAWQTMGVLRPGDYRLTRADARWRKGGLEFDEDTAALGWLEVERANLLAAVRQAAATPAVPDELAVQLTQALFAFYLVRSHWQDWLQANQTALGIARRAGDLAAQAQADNDLGLIHGLQGQYDQALACLRESLAMWRELDDRRGQAATLGNLGIVHERQGNFEQALACHQQSLALRERDDRRHQALCLGHLGIVYERQGNFEQALACQQQCLALYQELGDRSGRAAALRNLAVVYARQGRFEQALAHLQESLAQYRELGDRYGRAESLRELGVTLQALGRPEEARVHWREALDILEQLQTTYADSIRALLTREPARR